MTEDTQVTDVLYRPPRERFQDYLDVQLTKKNSTIITPETYNQIISFVKDNNTKISDSLRKRISRNRYVLMSYPTLGLNDVLCIPCAEVSLSHKFLVEEIHLFPHSFSVPVFVSNY